MTRLWLSIAVFGVCLILFTLFTPLAITWSQSDASNEEVSQPTDDGTQATDTTTSMPDTGTESQSIETLTPTVVPTPVPSPTPTPTPTCAASLQSLVDAAAPGSTVLVPACVYRELPHIRKPVTLDGQGHAELRGSDVWSNWSQAGGLWVSDQAVPHLATSASTVCLPGTNNACQHSEQVLIDGKALNWVPGTPSAGQFALSPSRNILLADTPIGHTVEVTTRQQWLDVQSDNVTIQGFALREVASAADVSAGLSNHGHNGLIVQDSVLSDAAGTIVSLDGGSGAQVLRNDISRAGQLGISAWQSVGAVIRGNKIHDNAIGQYDSAWAAGGLKFIATSKTTVDGNEVWNNAGPGIWFDIGCSTTTISSNHIHNNATNPIQYEISDTASISGNTIQDSGGWGGIVLSSSGNVDVFNNRITGSPNIRVLLENRSRPASAGRNVRVHDNTVGPGTQGPATTWLGLDPGVNGNVDKDNRVVPPT